MRYIGIVLVGLFIALSVSAMTTNWDYYLVIAPTGSDPYYGPWLHEHVIVLTMTEEFWLAAGSLIPGLILLTKSRSRVSVTRNV